MSKSERLEKAKREALKQAAKQGWADVSSGRYEDVADDQLENFVGQLGRRAVMPQWNIRLEGRAWSASEMFERHNRLPVPVEMLKGRLLLSQDQRLVLLGALLEQVGAAEAVKLGDPVVWRAAVAGLRMRDDEPDRARAIARLVGCVQTMVEQSGNPEGFNAAEWVARWIDRPLPALGGKAPNEFLGTEDGQALIEDLLSRMQSGAYS